MLILLVEDEDDVRGLLHLFLVRHGHDVLVATDGVEALHILAERAFDVDVVMTDLDLPRLGGRELTNRLANRAPKIRVVQMTGWADGQECPPGVAVLLKPFSLAALKSLLRSLFRESPRDELD